MTLTFALAGRTPASAKLFFLSLIAGSDILATFVEIILMFSYKVDWFMFYCHFKSGEGRFMVILKRIACPFLPGS